MLLKDAIDALRLCEAFRDLQQEDLGWLLLTGQSSVFAPRACLFRQGDESSSRFCVVVSGRFGVLIPGTSEPDPVLGPGALLGEGGIVNPRQKRTRTVRAEDPGQVLQWDMNAIRKERPPLASRLQDVFERISFERHAQGLD
jgi:CRP-like cAMP-binding protein